MGHHTIPFPSKNNASMYYSESAPEQVSTGACSSINTILEKVLSSSIFTSITYTDLSAEYCRQEHVLCTGSFE